MVYPLAVFVPQIGPLSETFVRRHVENLLPGRTVVVTGSVSPPEVAGWTPQCPVLALAEIREGFLRKVARVIGRRMRKEVPRDPRRAVLRFLRYHGVRTIMAEWLDWSLPWFELAREAGLRFFAHAHGYDVSARQLSEPRWRREYLRYRDADGVIGVSRVTRARLAELGLAGEKIHVVPCGVDVPAEPLIRQNGQPVRCLAVGRMTGKKAPIITLDAFRRAREVCPGLRLDYVGGGELLSAARQFVRAFELTECITLHGGQRHSTVLDLMSKADIFLQHSMVDPETGDEEGLPVAILEAMGAGLPVVSTRHAGIPEAVDDGRTGYLVEEGDSRAMGERIADLAKAHDLRVRMGCAGWEMARNQFAWEGERDQLLSILGL